jgi:hypothetical protein
MTHVQQILVDEWVDLVVLKDGRVLGIDGDSVCLYTSLDDFYDATSQTKPTINLKEQA